ncbi:MAG: alpha/beta hydrolase, partial [Alphaproteobacteria bacterium]|nr:alpha/beta hydrolase [Alphaproteobacteria bacterium]
MFEYFPDNYPWSMAALMTLNAGAVMSEIDEACRDLKPMASANDDAANDAWHANWSAMGDRNERLAKVDKAAGNNLSAGEKWLRAAVYYMTAERMCKSDDPQRFETYKHMLSCFRSGVEQRGDNMEWVEVPYKDTSLPAIFVPAQTSEPNPPCLIHFDGLDVMKEFLYLSGVAREYNRRGVSVLLVDHPGVGEALRLRDLKLFPEVEVPAAAAVDYLETRPDVDANRIGIAGISLGGYYAPRAAGFEHRLKCCVAWGAIWDYGPITEGRITGSGTALSVSHWEEHMNWVFGTSSADEILETARRMTLAEAVPNIQCPLLVVHGGGDRQIPLQMAHNTVDNATSSPRADLKIFGP